MDAFFGSNWPSEATSKANVIKYACEKGSVRFGTPPSPLKFSILSSSVRGKQGEPHRPMLPLTGSADDGKRSALYVLVNRGYQGDSSIQSFGLATASRGRRIFIDRRHRENRYFCTTSSIELNLFPSFFVWLRRLLTSACLRSSSGHFLVILKPFWNPMHLQDGPKQVATPLQRPGAQNALW